MDVQTVSFSQNYAYFVVIKCLKVEYYILCNTLFVPLAAQGAYQSHFRWALIKTLISRFFSLKLVIFEKKINGK